MKKNLIFFFFLVNQGVGSTVQDQFFNFVETRQFHNPLNLLESDNFGFT